MPRLKDLLEFLASPGLENVWLLLDIKVRTVHFNHDCCLIPSARQRRQQRHAADRTNHPVRSLEPSQPLESPLGPRLLVR